MSLCLSSMTRKSLYFGALGNCLKARSARLSSGSQRATMFSPAQPFKSVKPLPPEPMAAMLSFSEGDL